MGDWIPGTLWLRFEYGGPAIEEEDAVKEIRVSVVVLLPTEVELVYQVPDDFDPEFDSPDDLSPSTEDRWAPEEVWTAMDADGLTALDDEVLDAIRRARA